MKPYMSYWSGGYNKIPSKNIINMHKIGAYFLKKNFNEVHFITDSLSLPYFQDIDFSSTSTDFDVLPKEYGATWSLSKLYAYKIISQKGDAFFHTDYDAILWDGLPEDIKKSDLFSQCYEPDYFASYQVDQFLKNCPNLYLAQYAPEPKQAINMGIIGGNDLEFLYNYSDSALKLLFDPLNKKFWIDYSGFKANWCKAVILEQYYLAVAEIYYNKEIKMLFSTQWPEKDEVSKIKFTHLMGAKNDPEIIDKLTLIKKLLKI